MADLRPTLRNLIADDLDRLAVALWSLAHRIRPVYAGPLCPDCEIAPDPGPEGGCEVCAAKWAQQQLANAMAEPAWDQGYEAGFRDARHD